MRERIELALRWLEEHGLAEYLCALFMHEDGYVSMSLRDLWTFKSLSKEIDERQQAAIVASLAGHTANVVSGSTSRTYYLNINDTFRLTWTVFFKRHETAVVSEPQTIVIGQEAGE